VLDGVEGNNLLEEVESVVAEGSVGEVGDRGRARPRNNRDKENTKDNGTLDAVEHEHDSENATTEDANPLLKMLALC